MTPCLVCAAPCDGPRCKAHQRQHKAKYGPEHRRDRRWWKPRVDAGRVTCRRCGQRIVPGQPWDLGHPLPSHPEHADCNRSAR